MLELGMVRLVKNQEVYLVHGDKRVGKALMQYLCRADDDLVLLEMVEPDVFGPEVGSHGTAESCNFMV